MFSSGSTHFFSPMKYDKMTLCNVRLSRQILQASNNHFNIIYVTNQDKLDIIKMVTFSKGPAQIMDDRMKSFPENFALAMTFTLNDKWHEQFDEGYNSLSYFFVYTIVFTFCYENAKCLQIIRRKASFSRSEFLVRLKQHCKRISDMQWNNFKSLLNLVLSVLFSRSVLTPIWQY